MRNVLSVNGLTKEFGGQVILDGITFSIQEGDFVAIMGPSGSGKSTLLYSVSGLMRPEAGEIRIGKERMDDLSEEALSDMRLRNFGFVFQQPYLMKSLSVRENIVLSAAFLHHGLDESVLARAEELMSLTGIQDLAQRGIEHLSGGQSQRVGICRALICNPKILFADEPTGALNSRFSDEIMDIFLRLNAERQMTIMLVTHDAKVAAKAKQVWFLLDGAIQRQLTFGNWDGNRASLISRHEQVSSVMSQIEV